MAERVEDPVPPVGDPYPAGPAEVREVVYDNALVLVRLRDAAKMIEGGREDADYLVGADYTIRWRGSDGQGGTVTVPRGMPTDLTSVPRPFRWLIGRVGPWLEAAIVHDWLCVAWWWVDGRPSRDRRRFADDVMLAAMAAAEVNPVVRTLIWWAVRLAGHFHYDRRPMLTFIDFDAAEYRAQLPPGVRLPGYDATGAATDGGGVA